MIAIINMFKNGKQIKTVSLNTIDSERIIDIISEAFWVDLMDNIDVEIYSTNHGIGVMYNLNNFALYSLGELKHSIISIIEAIKRIEKEEKADISH